jgi:CCR4-NOT transcriptional regulation complex NOT5 subunit
MTRCPGPLFLGDPIHTITLLPGEKVKLFTSDRRTRFTFDSTTNLSYRNEQLSEDRYFMAAMQNSMSDLSVTDKAHSSSSESGKWDFHGDASGSLGFFSASADTNANGSHSGSSTSDFLRQLSTHATASANQSVQATHASASLSIGEVSTRTHVESQSEDHFESSSREFSNPNHCHAVTFYFYRLLRKQIVKITLEKIERRVDDPAAPSRVSLNPPVSRGQIDVVPASVLAK